jgi:hypothetical protein
MKVFISYASADRALAGQIADYLRSSGLDVWFDEWEILPGDNLANRIDTALHEADAMVVVLTPHALESKYVRSEIDYALGATNFKYRIIPVIAAPADQMPLEEIPWILRKFTMAHIDNQDRYEEGMQEIVNALRIAA